MDLNSIGSRIREEREKKMLTQETFAELVDLSPTHVSVIERGIKLPKLETFIRIANGLGVSADSLLLGVVDHASDSVSSELAELLSKKDYKEREKILKVVRVLVED